MAELGQTNDPRALVPGSPEAIGRDAVALAAHGDRLVRVGEGLKRVDVGLWSGPAAFSFVDSFAKEPPKWIKVGDSIGATAGVLTSYADTLRWAQGQAGAAIELWDLGVAASTAAADQYRAASADPNARHTAIAPFADPGAAYRTQAQELLNRARQQLQQIGDQAMQAIKGIGEPPGLPGGRGALGALVDAVTDGWVGQGTAGATGLGAGWDGPGPSFHLAAGEASLGELTAYAELVKVSAEGSLQRGDLSLAGKAEASVGVEAAGAAGVSKDGLAAAAEVSGGARAFAEGQANYGILGANGSAGAFGGGEANAGLTLSKSSVGVNAGAFAGGKLEGKAGGDVGGIGAGVTGGAWAGAGAEFDAGYEYEDGKFTLGVGVGAALGLGGKVGLEVTVDPDKVADTARDAADAVGRGLATATDAAEDLGDKAGDAAGKINPFD